MSSVARRRNNAQCSTISFSPRVADDDGDFDNDDGDGPGDFDHAGAAANFDSSHASPHSHFLSMA